MPQSISGGINVKGERSLSPNSQICLSPAVPVATFVLRSHLHRWAHGPLECNLVTRGVCTCPLPREPARGPLVPSQPPQSHCFDLQTIKWFCTSSVCCECNRIAWALTFSVISIAAQSSGFFCFITGSYFIVSTKPHIIYPPCLMFPFLL